MIAQYTLWFRFIVTISVIQFLINKITFYETINDTDLQLKCEKLKV